MLCTMQERVRNHMKIAFTGASGTGKTTLARWVSQEYGLPMEAWEWVNYSMLSTTRKLALALTGQAEPYLVDSLGLRTEFQYKLLEMKREWELAHPDGFVTDRTHVDNLAYSIMHDANGTGSDSKFVDDIVAAQEYDIVFYLGVDDFISVGTDSARKSSRTYQYLYDHVLQGLYWNHLGLRGNIISQVYTIYGDDLEDRKAQVRQAISRNTVTL